MQTAEIVVDRIVDAVINPLLALLFGIAFLYFLWGLVELVMNLDSDDARTAGRSHMLWGVIGMTIMISAYAIVSVARGTFGL